jgi:hypothetical protein
MASSFNFDDNNVIKSNQQSNIYSKHDDNNDYDVAIIENDHILDLDLKDHKLYPDLQFIDIGLKLINKVIVDSSNTLTNKDILKKIDEILHDDDNGLTLLNNITQEKDKKKLLEIIKKILDILNPAHPIIEQLYKLLFKSNYAEDDDSQSAENKSYKKKIELFLHKSILGNDDNLNYITKITNNAPNSFLEIENLLGNLNKIRKENPIVLEKILSKLLEKNLKPLKPGVIKPEEKGGGKSKKRNKKINKRSKIKKQKKHRNKTSKL